MGKPLVSYIYTAILSQIKNSFLNSFKVENAHCEEAFSRSSDHFKMTHFASYVFISPLLPQWNLLMPVALASFGIFCKYDPATTSYRRRVGAYVRCHQLLTKVTACYILWESYYRHFFIAWRKRYWIIIFFFQNNILIIFDPS